MIEKLEMNRQNIENRGGKNKTRKIIFQMLKVCVCLQKELELIRRIRKEGMIYRKTKINPTNSFPLELVLWLLAL